MEAKLFCGIMYADPSIYQKALGVLTKDFGSLEIEGKEFDFDFTNYYEQEFGKNLKKRFVVFGNIDREELPKRKKKTIEIENSLKKSGKRTINIDPGYVTKNNVVVATTKELPHRVYLGEGIFADLQLILKKSGAVVLNTTFADYKKNSDFFVKLRNLLQ